MTTALEKHSLSLFCLTEEENELSGKATTKTGNKF